MLQSLMKKLTTKESELVSCVWWVVWNARKKYIFMGNKPDPSVLITKATEVIEAYQKVKEPGLQQLKQKESKKQQHYLKVGTRSMWMLLSIEISKLQVLVLLLKTHPKRL